MKRYIALLAALALLLAGCGSQPEKTPAPQAQTPTGQEQTGTENITARLDVQALFTQRDRDGSFDESESTVITLNGTSAVCASDAVWVDGSTVTIIDEGTYILRGSLDDGMIVVNAAKEDKTQLVLDGASINSDRSAPIYIVQADKVFITLAEGSENTLSNGGSFEPLDENNIDGVIFSKEDVTFNGSGSLTVTSPAGHGIVSKDELTVTGGSYTVNSASHGLAGKDSVCIAGGAMNITAGKDGIHAENSDDVSMGYVYIGDGSFTISAEGDGISASNVMQLDGGDFQIVSGGGSENGSKQTSDNWGGFMGGSMGGKRPGMGGGFNSAAAQDASGESSSIKGLKASGELLISGGSYRINSADDAVHSNTDLTVAGGSFDIATGDDGFHADETLTIDAGTVRITESYEGLEGLHIKLTGGDITLVASDDGVNAAGGTDQSGFGGIRGDQFGGGRGGMGGGMSAGNGSIVISGGKLAVTASGDGIDANGMLEITGGYTTVCGPTQGDTATLDYDTSAVISGGVFIGTGASGMAQTFSDSEQGVISLNVGSQSAGTQISVTDSKGNVIIKHTPALNYAVAILSCPELIKGESYTVTIGAISEAFEAS